MLKSEKGYAGQMPTNQKTLIKWYFRGEGVLRSKDLNYQTKKEQFPKKLLYRLDCSHVIIKSKICKAKMKLACESVRSTIIMGISGSSLGN